MLAEIILGMFFAVRMQPHDLHEVVAKGREFYVIFEVKDFIVFVFEGRIRLFDE